MWTSKNRGRYDRSRSRYPSDLTDEESALVEPSSRGQARRQSRHVVVREVVNGLMYILSTGVSGGIAKDLPPRSTLYDYFRPMGWTARSIASTTRSMRSAAKPPRARRARPPRSSTARASRARKRGPAIDPTATMQAKNQGQEAPHPRRYAGLADARDRPRRRRPGPRRRRAADGELVSAPFRPDQLYSEAATRDRSSRAR